MVPILGYITVPLRRYLNPDMFHYAINSVTSYPSLHPTIQDLGFTSSPCLQERVEGKDKQSIGLSAYTVQCLSVSKDKGLLIFRY